MKFIRTLILQQKETANKEKISWIGWLEAKVIQSIVLKKKSAIVKKQLNFPFPTS